jgi:transcriptional regulator NrdR family protein
MDGKIKKCKKDLNSLYRTLGSLKSRNEKLKTSLIVRKNGELHDFKRQELDEKVSAESEQMWAKKKELEALNASIEQGALNLKEKSIQVKKRNLFNKNKKPLD